MKLKLNKNGGVDFVLITGANKVKSTMLVSEAQDLVKSGKLETKGNQVIVDGKFIFDIEGGEPLVSHKEEPAIEEEEEPKVEDKPLSEAVKESKPKKPRRKKK